MAGHAIIRYMRPGDPPHDSGGNPPAAARGQSNITFLHLAIDGNKSKNPTSNSGSGLELMDVSDVLVSSRRIENVPRDALTIGGVSGISSNITIHRPVLLNNGLPGVNGGSGLAIVRGHGIMVTGIWAAGNVLFDVVLEPNPQDPPEAVSDVQIKGGVLGSMSAEAPRAFIGFAISTSTGQVSGVLIRKVISVGNGRGFSVQGAKSIQFQNCLAYRNGQDGFYINNATAVVLKRNRAIETANPGSSTTQVFASTALIISSKAIRLMIIRIFPPRSTGLRKASGLTTIPS
jgi:hypothetical protein